MSTTWVFDSQLQQVDWFGRRPQENNRGWLYCHWRNKQISNTSCSNRICMSHKTRFADEKIKNKLH